MFKMDITALKITTDDINRFLESGRANITVRPKDDVLTLALVSDEEARRLVQQEGGRAV
jgi:hypothetical protein